MGAALSADVDAPTEPGNSMADAEQDKTEIGDTIKLRLCRRTCSWRRGEGDDG